MIDWRSLIFGAFWLGGIALLLAAFGFQSWFAHLHHRSLRDQLRKREFPFWGWLALALVTFGLSGTAVPLWRSALWAIFTIINLFFAWQSWRDWHKHDKTAGDTILPPWK